MKLGTFAFVAGSLALGLATWITPVMAQGPMWDVVHVNLPYTVTLGEKTLQPGEYTIQQLRDNGGGSRVLLVYSDNGMKFETSAMTIPALDPDTARDTKVTLHHLGQDYYFDKIWIQGKDYGYEFPLPGSVKAREKEQVAAVSVPAQYSSTPANTAATTAATNATTGAATNATTGAATSAATTAATTAATRATTAQTTTPPVTSTPATQPQSSTSTATTAQSTVPAATTPSTTPAASTSNSADRAAPESSPAPTPTSMPATSAGWLMMLLGGGSLSGIGMALRRKR